MFRSFSHATNAGCYPPDSNCLGHVERIDCQDDALNRAYCGYPQKLLTGGHCRTIRHDIGWACPNDTDENVSYCDECLDAMVSGDYAGDFV